MSKLIRRMRREALAREHAELVDRALRESVDQRVPITSRGGDARAMRGVPISALGVPGTLPGTDPEREAMRERPSERRGTVTPRREVPPGGST